MSAENVEIVGGLRFTGAKNRNVEKMSAENVEIVGGLRFPAKKTKVCIK